MDKYPQRLYVTMTQPLYGSVFHAVKDLNHLMDGTVAIYELIDTGVVTTHKIFERETIIKSDPHG